MLGYAHGLNPKAIFTEDSTIDSLDGLITATVAADSEVYCNKEFDAGTAGHYYADFTHAGGQIVPPNIDQFEKSTQLAYKCGVRDKASGAKIPFASPPLLFDSFSSDGEILIKFHGTCETTSITFLNSSLTNPGSYTGTQQYNATVSSSIVYGCVQAQAAFGGVTASLSLRPVADAPFIVNTQFTDQLKYTNTNDGKTFSVVDAPLHFDLGTEKPHFSYYEALASCQSGLCKGSLILSSGQAKKTLITDLMNSTKFDKADKQVFKACTSTARVSEEREYTLQEACYGSATLEDVLETASGNLLDTLECPFGGPSTTSSPANLQACWEQSAIFDNRCEESLTRVGGDSTQLGSVYTFFLTNDQVGDATNRSFTYDFVDTRSGPEKRFETITPLTLTSEPIFVEPDTLRYDVVLNLKVNETFQEVNDKVVGIKLKDDATGWSAFVELAGTQITLSGVPRRVDKIDLVGKVRTGCQIEEQSLLAGGAVTLAKQIVGTATGEFVQEDPCQDLFLFYRTGTQQGAVNVTHASGVARLTGKEVRICGSHTAGCDASTDKTIDMGSSSDQFAYIQGACNYVRDLGVDQSGKVVQETVYVSKGDVVGYVLTDQSGGTFAHIPIKCGGFCRDNVVRLPDLSLDWEVEFKVDQQTGHELVADQEKAAYNDFQYVEGTTDRHYSLSKTAYLAKTTDDICLASGDLDGDVPTSGVAPGGCLVYSDSSETDGSFDLATATTFSNVNSANDMIAWLTACGAPLSDGSGAKAQLVQKFEIDYGSYDRSPLPAKEAFCHTNDLTLFVQKKVIGVSSASLAVTEVIGSAASNQISAGIGNFAFEQCLGGYKIAATVDLFHSGITDTFSSDSTGSEFGGSLLAGNNVFKWESECKDVCADDAATLTNWTTGTKTLLASVEAGGAKASVAFEVQMRGTPCADEESFDGSGTVTLDLYTAESATCNATDTRTNDAPKADEKLCAHLKFNHEGAFELKVTDTQVTRKAQNGLAQVLCETGSEQGCIGSPRGVLFQSGRTLNSTHNEATSSGIFSLDQSDAFSTVTYVVFWEQNYKGGSRRLRSTHVFGAGEKSSTASLSVLPASAQIGEAVDAGDSVEVEQTYSATTTPSSEEKTGMEAWTDAQRIGFWIGMAVLAILVLLGLYSKQKHGNYTQSYVNLSKGKAPLRKDGYRSVRRSERFSTSYF